MDPLFDETISDVELKRFEDIYKTALRDGGSGLAQANFQYAYALVRSKHNKDIKLGVSMLEALYSEGDHDARRDYLYYMALGHTRLHQYTLALDCVERFLEAEPENAQALNLRKSINERLTKDGLLGMAITGGVVLAVTGLVGVAMALAKR